VRAPRNVGCEARPGILGSARGVSSTLGQGAVGYWDERATAPTRAHHDDAGCGGPHAPPLVRDRDRSDCESRHPGGGRAFRVDRRRGRADVAKGNPPRAGEGNASRVLVRTPPSGDRHHPRDNLPPRRGHLRRARLRLLQEVGRTRPPQAGDLSVGRRGGRQQPPLRSAPQGPALRYLRRARGVGDQCPDAPHACAPTAGPRWLSGQDRDRPGPGAGAGFRPRSGRHVGCTPADLVPRSANRAAA